MSLSGSIRVSREVPFRVLKPSGSAPALGWPAVLALHGYGWDEERFEPVVRRRFPGTPWVWIVPRGPWRIFEAPGAVGYGWLVGSKDHPDLEGMVSTERFLAAVLRKTGKAVPIDRRRVALLGFSQGGFAAGVTVLRNPKAWRGAAVLGAYVNPKLVPKGLSRARQARIAFFHGSQDRDVPPWRPRKSVAALAEAGIRAPLAFFPGGHKLSRPMAKAAQAFLKEALA